MFSSGQILRLTGKIKSYIRPHVGALFLAAVSMLAVTGIHLARPLILRELIDNALPRRDIVLAGKLGMLFIGLLGVGAFALYSRAVLLARVGTSIMARLKEDVLSHLLSLRMSFFDSVSPGKLISRSESDVEQMRALVSGAAAQLIANFLTLSGISVMIWYQEPALGRWIALGTIGGGIMVFLFAHFIQPFYKELRERDSEISARLTEYLQGVSLIRLYSKEPVAVGRISDAVGRKCGLELKVGFFDTVLFYGSFTFAAEIGCLSILLWHGTGEVFAGRMTVGTLVMFLELMRRFFGPLRDLAEVFMMLQAGLTATCRVFDLLDSVPERLEAWPGGARAPGGGECGRIARMAQPSRKPREGFREISFNDVVFAYSRERVLDGVGFRIRRGQRVAIVGASGSGKSTCINLLLRFYDPLSGQIRVDGMDLREFEPVAWRKRVALVLQEIHLFPGTVLDNLRAFAPEVHEGRVVSAAAKMGADSFIRRLPNGYGTVLAERGANLSLGERQLLCYVRALVRNPELLVLDEATSAIDSRTERKLQEAMQRLMKGRTAVIIAHRLSTIVDSDLIVVLDHGRVAQTGTHQELLGRKGIYRQLAVLQGVEKLPRRRFLSRAQAGNTKEVSCVG